MTSSDSTPDAPRPPIAAVATSRGVVAEEMNLIVDAPGPPQPRSTRRKGGVVTSSLAAAMLAIGDIVEPQRSDVGIEAVAEDPGSTDSLLNKLDFGELPPLN